VKGSIWSPECTGCLECVAVCPAKGALAMSATRRKVLPAWAIAGGIAALFLGIVGAARLTGNWHTEIDPRVYGAVIRQADQLDHPR
jgi:ferredoxin